MPRTKTAQNKMDAKFNTLEKPIRPVAYGTESNFKYITSLDRNELSNCIEYLFLLREINGMTGFTKTLKDYKEKLPECWDEIRKSNMAGLFRDKNPGFINKWMNQRIYLKIKGLTLEQMAQWLTYFDRSSAYRGEILKGDRHQLLAYIADDDIVEWLNEV